MLFTVNKSCGNLKPKTFYEKRKSMIAQKDMSIFKIPDSELGPQYHKSYETLNQRETERDHKRYLLLS
jgi:hypothetical protein